MEANAEELQSWHRVASVKSVPEGEMLATTVAGTKVAIYHLEDGTIWATGNVCTHEFALLTDGWLEGCEIECPLHAGRFDVRTGKGLCSPIERDVSTYPIEVRGEDLYILMPEKG